MILKITLSMGDFLYSEKISILGAPDATTIEPIVRISKWLYNNTDSQVLSMPKVASTVKLQQIREQSYVF